MKSRSLTQINNPQSGVGTTLERGGRDRPPARFLTLKSGLLHSFGPAQLAKQYRELSIGHDFDCAKNGVSLTSTQSVF
jgi:hypothetical protein